MQPDAARQIDELILLKGNFAAASTGRKRVLLKQLLNKPVGDAAQLKRLHELLLFMLAYPGDKELYELAHQQLRNLKTTADKIFSSYAPREQRILNGSGICSSELVCAYSYEIACWLCNTFGSSVSLHSSHADPELVTRILSPFLPAAEYQEVTQGNYGLPKRIQKLTGKKNNHFALQWLLDTLQDKAIPPQLSSSLYEQLQVYVHWKLDHPFFNRTFLRSLPPERICFRDSMPLLKDHHRYINKKINAAEKLPAGEKIKLLDIARTALALHSRETDPVTFGDSRSVKYFNMGDGISIALYSMQPQKRFSIESYIGYMAFVNSVPAAYGGGWILGHRCKVGISIFPALRGGNSTLLFASILRLYHRYFNINRFVVKPYQFGKNNPDGLRSGAFWFYHKLGFRPADPLLLKLADEEYKKRASGKNHRTSLAVLKKFTAAPLELLLNKNAWPQYDAARISKAITKNIIREHKGNRQRALAHYTGQLTRLVTGSGKKITAAQRRLLAGQALWMAIIFSNNEKMQGWTKKEKQQLTHLLLSKYGPDERDHIIRLQQHKKFRETADSIIEVKSIPHSMFLKTVPPVPAG